MESGVVMMVAGAATKEARDKVVDTLSSLPGVELVQMFTETGKIVVSGGDLDPMELSDRVEGLDCGADYYLTKPFEPKELLACIRAITRRTNDAVDNAVTFGDLRLELDSCQLFCGDRSVRLSKKEFEILSKLMANGDKVVTKEQLILSVWGYESDAEDNNVEVYISFLRKKLRALHSGVQIKSIRNAGYHLEVQP